MGLDSVINSFTYYFHFNVQHYICYNSYFEQTNFTMFRWAAIASQLPGRTDNEIKNFWNTHLKKRLKTLGLDPKTHQPNHAPSASSSISTRHMAQWEGARLEAEARLSSLNTTKTTHHCDHFLRMWNSEIGDSFRNFHKPDHNQNKNINSFCLSPLSAGSSSNKCDSVSAVTTNAADPFGSSNNAVKQELLCAEEDVIQHHGSDSSCSNDLEDSSDTALQLLLDFPIYNDMSFLEGNSFVCPLQQGFKLRSRSWLLLHRGIAEKCWLMRHQLQS